MQVRYSYPEVYWVRCFMPFVLRSVSWRNWKTLLWISHLLRNLLGHLHTGHFSLHGTCRKRSQVRRSAGPHHKSRLHCVMWVPVHHWLKVNTRPWDVPALGAYLPCRSEAPWWLFPCSAGEPAQTKPCKFTKLNRVVSMNPLQGCLCSSSRCQCASVIKEVQVNNIRNPKLLLVGLVFCVVTKQCKK